MAVTNVIKIAFFFSFLVCNVTPGECFSLGRGIGNLLHGVGDAAVGAVNGVGNVAHGVLSGVGNTLKSIGLFPGHKKAVDQTNVPPVPIEITPPPVSAKTSSFSVKTSSLAEVETTASSENTVIIDGVPIHIVPFILPTTAAEP